MWYDFRIGFVKTNDPVVETEMEKQDKCLIVLATALIILAMVWFARFSSQQQTVIDADTLIQILDTDHGRRPVAGNACISPKDKLSARKAA